MSIRVALALTALLPFAASAQPRAPAAAPQPGPPPTQDSLRVLFESGSATLRPQDGAILDRAARTFRDGNPIVMVVSGSADSTGTPDANLRISEARAQAVLRGLVARGIPVERFQVTAKGATDPLTPAAPGTPEAQNRRVDITWR